MAYREPGAYSEIIQERQYAVGNPTALIPYIIGTGAEVLSKMEVVTRGDGDVDILEREALEIIMIGKIASRPGYEPATETKATVLDEDLEDPLVDPEVGGEGTEEGETETENTVTGDYKHVKGSAEITWLETDNRPEPGDQYYVKYTYKVGGEQFKPRLVESQHIEMYYGKDLREFEVDKETGEAPINRLVVAAQIAFEEGATELYMHQIPASEALHVDYKKGLEKYTQFLPTVYRICPVDSSAEINNVIDAHIEMCSSYEERKERTAFYGAPGAEECEEAEEVIAKVGGYTAAKKFKRVAVPYPCSGTRVLSDGKEYVLDAPFVSAALTGAAASIPVSRSLTRHRIRSFGTLLGQNLTRRQMNKLAEKGVIILTQEHGPNTAISVRHQITTDYPEIQNREISVVRIHDYVSKYMRAIAENYIGPYNVTGETMTRLQSAMEAGFYDLTKAKVITRGEVVQMRQDEFHPDTILVTLRIYVPYPCNYIDITILAV